MNVYVLNQAEIVLLFLPEEIQFPKKVKAFAQIKTTLPEE